MNIKSHLLRFWNFWPPLFFSGIKITKRSEDYRSIKVKLKLRFWNSNYLGTQFGGSIYAMTDPFYMIMLIKNLGSGYHVWDKGAKIRYLKPGRTDLFADFHLSEDDIQSIKEIMKEQDKMEWTRKVEIKDKNNEIVAEVEKIVSIKKAPPKQNL